MSNFLSLRLEKILGMVYIFLNLLRLVLWPNVCFLPEDAHCELVKKGPDLLLSKSSISLPVFLFVLFSFFVFVFLELTQLLLTVGVKCPTIDAKLFLPSNLSALYMLGLCGKVPMDGKLLYLLDEFTPLSC